MFASVTENASSVTDVVTLLSGLGYDSKRRDAGMKLAIDKFDQWANPSGSNVRGCDSIPCIPVEWAA